MITYGGGMELMTGMDAGIGLFTGTLAGFSTALTWGLIGLGVLLVIKIIQSARE